MASVSIGKSRCGRACDFGVSGFIDRFGLWSSYLVQRLAKTLLGFIYIFQVVCNRFKPGFDRILKRCQRHHHFVVVVLC